MECTFSHFDILFTYSYMRTCSLHPTPIIWWKWRKEIITFHLSSAIFSVGDEIYSLWLKILVPVNRQFSYSHFLQMQTLLHISLYVLAFLKVDFQLKSMNISVFTRCGQIVLQLGYTSFHSHQQCLFLYIASNGYHQSF